MMKLRLGKVKVLAQGSHGYLEESHMWIQDILTPLLHIICAGGITSHYWVTAGGWGRRLHLEETECSLSQRRRNFLNEIRAEIWSLYLMKSHGITVSVNREGKRGPFLSLRAYWEQGRRELSFDSLPILLVKYFSIISEDHFIDSQRIF